MHHHPHCPARRNPAAGCIGCKPPGKQVENPIKKDKPPNKVTPRTKPGRPRRGK